MRVNNPLNPLETIASILVLVLCVVGANVSQRQLGHDAMNLYWQDNFTYLQDEELGEDASADSVSSGVYWRMDDGFEKL
jgi:hypothetical protein